MNHPAVSCIMPTADRPLFIPLAINCFLNQDYQNAELIIVDNGLDQIQRLLPDHPKIKYFYYNERMSVGKARNIACSLSSGEIIVHWDDDDWYASDWISFQVSCLMSSLSDVCGLNRVNFYILSLNKTEIFVDSDVDQTWVYGSTFAYWRSFWDNYLFRDLQVGEDNDFLLRSGARVYVHNYTDGYIGVVHNRNLTTNYFENLKQKIQVEKWIKEISAPEILTPEILHFDENTPLVSCVMPTANRRDFLPFALEYFLKQDYPNKEMIVLDNGQDNVEDIIPKDDRIRYFCVEPAGTLGSKRNKAIALAKGELITHWDDDDWYAPDWISRQVYALLNSGAELCGINQVQFFSPSQNKYWMTKNMNSKTPWLTGASLIYRKTLWENYPFIDLQIGDDDDFIRNSTTKVFAHDYYQGFIATLHPENTTIKFFEDSKE